MKGVVREGWPLPRESLEELHRGTGEAATKGLRRGRGGKSSDGRGLRPGPAAAAGS